MKCYQMQAVNYNKNWINKHKEIISQIEELVEVICDGKPSSLEISDNSYEENIDGKYITVENFSFCIESFHLRPGFKRVLEFGTIFVEYEKDVFDADFSWIVELKEHSYQSFGETPLIAFKKMLVTIYDVHSELVNITANAISMVK